VEYALVSNEDFGNQYKFKNGETINTSFSKYSAKYPRRLSADIIISALLTQLSKDLKFFEILM
jgi:hypothetical protein